MLVWDETDVLTVLEVLPEVERDEIWHKYSVLRNGIELKLTIYQYDGDVHIEVFNTNDKSRIFNIDLIGCDGVRRKNDKTGEYLEFAPATCFGGRYDGQSNIPFGVRLQVQPSINVSLYG